MCNLTNGSNWKVVVQKYKIHRYIAAKIFKISKNIDYSVLLNEFNL